MWISPMRFQVQKLELMQTEALCPRCGGKLGLLESQLAPEYFSRLLGQQVKTQRFLLCTRCGCQLTEQEALQDDKMEQKE